MLGTRERIFAPMTGRSRSPAPGSRTWLFPRRYRCGDPGAIARPPTWDTEGNRAWVPPGGCTSSSVLKATV